MHFAEKFRRGPWVQVRALLALLIDLLEYTRKANLAIHLPPKSCCNFTLQFKVGSSWSIVITELKSVLKLHANTSSHNAYWRKRPNRRTHLELSHRNPDALERVLNWIALSNSTVGKNAPMQVSCKTTRTRESFNNWGTKTIINC